MISPIDIKDVEDIQKALQSVIFPIRYLLEDKAKRLLDSLVDQGSSRHLDNIKFHPAFLEPDQCLNNRILGDLRIKDLSTNEISQIDDDVKNAFGGRFPDWRASVPHYLFVFLKYDNRTRKQGTIVQYASTGLGFLSFWGDSGTRRKKYGFDAVMLEQELENIWPEFFTCSPSDIDLQ